MKLKLLLLSGFVLSACDVFEEPKPVYPGSTFNRVLARNYMLLSEKQELRRDWNDAQRFKSKADNAAHGMGVLPEHPEDWELRPEMRPLILSAREKLMEKVDGRAIRLEPELSAQAFSSYDCWVEQESNWWLGDETTCKTRFFDTIDLLSISPVIAAEIMKDDEHLQRMKEQAKAKEPKDKAESSGELSPEEAIKKKIIVDKSGKVPDQGDGYVRYVLYYEGKTTKLDKSALKALNDIAAEYKKMKYSEVNVNGYTDTVGNEESNFEVSQKRAEAVASTLRKKGVDGDKIIALGFGESDQQAATEDEVANKLNRRVEVQMK